MLMCKDAKLMIISQVSAEDLTIITHSVYNLKFIGLCAKFPGEKCSYPSWTEECRYGTQKCEDGVCESVGHNGKCSESRDCPSHQYCAGSSGTSFDGTCTKFKEIGQECTHRHEYCRTATCWYRNTYSGVNGRYTGICEDGNLSLEKGKECTADTDCPSDKTGVFAKCSCGWSSTAGDEEWEDARTAFKTYFGATKNDCNVASRWGECNDPKLYKDRRCKKLKAENYAYLLHNKTELACMEILKRVCLYLKILRKFVTMLLLSRSSRS
ncbi:unnamed protein product [Moneuplotes crassus]|uniref:Uncharacterized protein n=1 Tax=Euplotes crassus TaxID=5936 RepID=A0AAD1UP92_EUPCR|nr:unnamed protein product [Moneuplotes crassus]